MRHPVYPHIFQPLTVRHVTFKNRIFCAPSLAHQTQYTQASSPETPYLLHYVERAKGGAACVSCGGQPVVRTNKSKIHAKLEITDQAGWRNFIRLTDAIHMYDAKCAYELVHFGTEGEFDSEARSQKQYGCSDFVRADGLHFYQMPEDEMDKLADRYADLAEGIKECGFDTLLLHGGHGTLLQEFLSPRSNHRTDGYGGCLENRAKFPRMVLDRIRRRVGRDLLIEYRISGSECVEGGFEIDECIAYTKLIQDQIDIIHVSAGMVREPRLRGITHPTGFLPPAPNAWLAAAVKADPEITVPVLTVGAFKEPILIEQTLAEGKADLVAMARAIIADPAIPEKSRLGQEKEIRPCIKCFYCLDGFKNSHACGCSVNAEAGREFELALLPHTRSRGKRVAVIGGGPGGMTAALECAKCGHSVTLYEKEPALGGQLKEAAHMEFKYDLKEYKDYLIRQIGASTVDVHLGHAVTPKELEGAGYDVVICAIGAAPLIPPIPGADGSNVLWAGDSLFVPERMGQDIVIVGAGQVGCETAVYYGMQGKRVTVLEMMPEIARDAMRTYREELIGQLEDHHCVVFTGCKCLEISAGRVIYQDSEGQRGELKADTVLLAVGMRSRRKEAETFRKCAPIFRKIGDCEKVGTVRLAVRTGWNVAYTL